jgi:uncharacterized RDD family membrane protein YckC
MEMPKCEKCGEVFDKWAEFCPSCAEPMPGYARPAGFWIRVGAYIIDSLVFIPIMALGFWNAFSLRSTVVLVLTFVPGFLYKPCMEAFCGATLGKMSCGLKVIDPKGKKISLFYAYVRSFPFLLSAAIGLASQLILFSLPQFQEGAPMHELSQSGPKSFVDAVSLFVNLLVLIDCVAIAFTFRKRALHDMLAESFCVYKEPQA